MQIKFENVGRGKETWTAEVAMIGDVLGEIRRHGGLMSHDISYDFDDKTQTGTIIVGGWRPVGTFKILDKYVIDLA